MRIGEMVDTPLSKLAEGNSLDGTEPVWVSQLSASVTISAATISALASDNSYNDSGSGFVAAGFQVNDYVNVQGFTGNVANNIFSAKITALTTGKMTIGGSDGNVIVDDAAGETVAISKWLSVRRPAQDIADLALVGEAVKLISEVVTTGSATNVSFTSISAAYRDLEVRIRGRGTKPAVANVDIRMRFNGDTGANYDTEIVQGNGSTASAFGAVGETSAFVGNLAAATATANVADAIKAEVFDYRGTTFQKAALCRSSLKVGTAAIANLYTLASSNYWRSTAAITQIDVFPSANGFVDGTVVSLYGQV